MRKRGRSIVFVFCILAGLSAGAQDVEFVGSVKPTVSLGETFSLSYTVNAQGVNFKGPNLGNFFQLSGPNTSTTSSIRTINGRTTMSMAYTYTFLLQANKEGSFDIGPATVTVDGKVYKSNSLAIKVVKVAGTSPGQAYSQNPNAGRSQQQNPGAAAVSANDVYLKAFVDNANPIQGEGIVVTFKLFTKLRVQQLGDKINSSFPGFWSQNITKDSPKYNQYNQTIDGQQYLVAEIRKIALFPLKSGKLIIEPQEVECVAQVKSHSKSRTGDPFFDDFFNDPFFNNSMASVEKSLKSNPLVINVRPLPTENKPADFSGAVGNFIFNSSIDKAKLKTNEPINLKFTISGQGNIQLIDKMNVSFPPDFDTYDPKINSDIKTTSSGVSGTQAFEYLIIPRKPGKFTIKPVTFSYYDLNKKKYITQSSPQFDIEVEKGTGDNSAVVYSSPGKEDIKYIGSDIRFIRNQPIQLYRAGAIFFASIPFYLFISIPIIIFVLFLVFWRRQSARRSDVVLMRNRKATKVAKKRLKKAYDSLKINKEEEFYEDVSQALWGYLSDKFSIPLADLSIDSVSEALISKNVNDEIVNQFKSTLNNTEFARFAPGEKSMKMEKIYNEALEVITRNERELR
jgi:hypothetical protein